MSSPSELIDVFQGNRPRFRPVPYVSHEDSTGMTPEMKGLFDQMNRELSLEKKAAMGTKAFEELSALATIPFFDNLDLRSMRLLSQSFTRRNYEAGERIVEEGKSAGVFCVIVSGRVRVSARTLDQKEVELSQKGQGQYFGETALINRKSIQPVTVVALDRSVILTIAAEDFAGFCEDHPEINVSIEHQPLSVKVQLKEVPFFSGIGELKLQQLATLFELKRCEGGDVICRQGDEGNGFYVIVAGRVNVSVFGPNGEVFLGVLTKGDWFGEIALIQNTVRTATLTAVQSCTLLYLSKLAFNTFLNLAPEIKTSPLFTQTISKRTANSLKAIPLFSFLQRKHVGPLQQFDEQRLGLLGELFSFKQYEADQTIFREGDVADAFYIIVRGTVNVMTRSHEGEDDGKGIILTTLKDNDWFGEIALVQNTRRTATVVTVTECVLLRLAQGNFQRFLQICPQMQSTLERVISVRTAQTLRNIPFFRHVRENKPWSKLEYLGSLFEFEHHLVNAVVCREGDPADKFYVIVDGSVKVTKSVWGEKGQEVVTLEVLRKDNWFGEIALFKETCRTATVTCLEDCLFLTIHKDKFAKFTQIAPDLMAHFQSLVNHRTANLLRSIDFFYNNINENKPWSKFELLASMFSYESVDAKSPVVRVSDGPSAEDKFFIIAVGAVDVTTGSGTEAKTVRVQRGGFFGEAALLGSSPQHLTVTAVEPCVFFTLTREKFNQFLKFAPEMRAAMESPPSIHARSSSAIEPPRDRPLHPHLRTHSHPDSPRLSFSHVSQASPSNLALEMNSNAASSSFAPSSARQEREPLLPTRERRRAFE